MTTAVTPRKAGPFAGDGVTVLFPFTYKIFATTDVVVTKTDVNGVETILAITTNYTVAMNADQNASPGGSVTALVVPAVNEKITLSSSVPEAQGTSLPQGGAFAAKVVENALDKCTILVGQLSEKIARALRFPISDSAASGDLPTTANRANKFLVFDAAGQPAVSAGSGTDTGLRTDLAASGATTGAALLAFIQSAIGAVAETVQGALRRFLFVSQFGALAQALTAAITKRLHVDGAIAINVDTTIPATLELYMMKGGVFNVATTKTLTINSPFRANLFQVFSCAGTGKVIFGTGVVTEVYPEWFGGFADAGVTDNAPPTQLAANSIPWGGKLKVPAGWRKYADEVTLHAGITVEGDGCADAFYGAPPPAGAIPSFLYQVTNNKAIFVITGGMSHITVRNLSLSSALVPAITGAPDVTGKYGIKIQGSYPQFVWTLIFENITFFTLERGISCVDPNAGTNGAPYNYDWSVAPVSVRDCRTMYCKYGVYIDTNNADYWVYERDSFNVGNGGAGVYLRRWGLQFFVRSFFGGATINGNTGIEMVGNGGVTNDAMGVDNVTIDSCQWETLTHAITVDVRGANNAYTYQFTLHIKNSVPQMGADIDIRNWCHIITENCELWSPMYALAPATGKIKISTINDWYDPTTPGRWYILGGDERDYVQTIKLGPVPPTGPALMANPVLIENGRVWKYDGAAPLAGQWYRGDRIIFSAPAVGSPKAWVCTLSGIPGTWVSEGNL